MSTENKEKMVKARSGNRAVIIPKEKTEMYLEMGYSVYSLTGEKIAEPGAYRSKLEEASKRIVQLTSELEEVKRENEHLTRQIKRQIKASGK